MVCSPVETVHTLQSTIHTRMRIFISAGEASGDAYGAALVREISRLAGSSPDNLANFFSRDVEDHEQLDQIGVEDSLDIVEYVMALEDELGIDVPDDDVPQLKTVGDLRNYIHRRTGRRPSFERNDLTFEGVGGPRLKAEGVQLHADSSQWGAISIAQGVRVGVGILPKYLNVKQILKQGKPGLFIPIDFGFANIRLARHAKQCGWKVLYFVPPGSWRRDKQGKDLPLITDQIVTPFEWSAEILIKMGAKAHWFGHPIKQLISEKPPLPPPTSALPQTVAILPGSRKHELEMTLPLIAAAVQGVTGKWNGRNLVGLSREEIQAPKPPLPYQLEFALAPSVDANHVQAEWAKLAPGRSDRFTTGDTYGVLRRARAAIICSGTATLEAAVCICPMLVVYQLSPAMRREAKLLRMKQPKFISLPNIIQDREIVPELADGHGVYPEQVRAWLDRLLTDEEVRTGQIRELGQLVDALGPDDAITKTAELALQMISGDSPERT